MNSREIEIWALRVVKQAQAKQPSEDKLSELKREWPTEHNKAARRIAGHANAAGGEPILWLIGVDERNGTVIGADHQELTKWLPGVTGQFEGLAPRCEDVNIQINNGPTVVALVFESSRAPYIVKNPEFGVSKTPIAYEVPFREGTSVRSATRADLLVILSEKQSLKALLGELEWNVAVAGREGYGLERFRTKEFHYVLNNGSLATAGGDLKSLLTEAYMLIDAAQGYKRVLESTSDGANQGRIQNEMHKAKAQANVKAIEALQALREFFGRQ